MTSTNHQETNHRFIILDTETTGLNAYEGDRIVEIGALEMINRKLTGNKFHCYLNPDKEMSEETIRIHGITNESLVDKPRFADISDEFFDFIKNTTLIIHNASFDLKFLKAEFEQTDKPERVNIEEYCQIIDTLSIARQLHPRQRNSLDALCKRYEIDNSKRTFHGALLDSELLYEVYLRLTGGQHSLNISNDNIQPNINPLANDEKLITRSDNQHQVKVIYANEEEIKNHQDFLNHMHQKQNS